MPLDVVQSTRGKFHLIHDGHRFIEDRKTAGKTTWNCIDRRHFKCPARVHTLDGTVIFYKDNHNHPQDVAKITSKRVIGQIKQVSLESTEGPQNIIANSTVGLKEADAAALPSVRALTRVVQRNRQAVNYPLAIPSSSAQLELPEKYKKTLANENFILVDSGPAPDRILVFGTTRNLDLMETCDHWYADGTFKVVPSIFQQVRKDSIGYISQKLIQKFIIIHNFP